ncbi:TetR/AcrR family transcriptional regulator [Chelativorans sp. Marseille-P2723]|uniref:TetR/AcrR family transcriptional regulator n=1 Tax=Chelativorans sp. Marseille-P2723 TaxID=2709133 RepID=UPI00156E573B|nr:TetR/AcrR family transcriptional regulator [Chelativorans sp. Marseille-P2723]
MARTIGSDGAKTKRAICVTALKLIASHGYEAMSMRQLAAEVGIQPATVYRYFPTKQDLLYSLMRSHMEALTASWQTSRPAGSDPVAQLMAFVENHIRFHASRRHSTQVSNMELRSLSPERLTNILRLRNGYEKELRQILRDGAASNCFRVDDIALTAMAIIQMVTGVIVWFRPDKRLSVEEVAATYHRMTLRLVGATS